MPGPRKARAAFSPSDAAITGVAQSGSGHPPSRIRVPSARGDPQSPRMFESGANAVDPRHRDRNRSAHIAIPAERGQEFRCSSRACIADNASEAGSDDPGMPSTEAARHAGYKEPGLRPSITGRSQNRRWDHSLPPARTRGAHASGGSSRRDGHSGLRSADSPRRAVRSWDSYRNSGLKATETGCEDAREGIVARSRAPKPCGPAIP
jgi:hypothetical protein